MKKKKGIAILLSCSMLLAGTMMPAPHASAAKKIKLNKKKLVLKVGDTYKLKLKNCKKKIKWRSSKKKIATVNSKGKVKAKKAGTTIISAKVKGKRYNCRVKVTKAASSKVSPKVTATPKKATPTKAPNNQPNTPVSPQSPATNTPAGSAPVGTSTATPVPTATTVPAPAPTLNPLAKNISTTTQILSQHILLSVTNNNTVWMDTVDISYDYYDVSGENIASGFTSLYYLPPQETQYISIPFEHEFSAIDETLSETTIDVIEADNDGEYLDLQEKVTITAGEIDTLNAYMPITIFNHSAYDANGSYAVLFYDTEHNLIDAVCNTYTANSKTSYDEIINLPYRMDDETGEMEILSTEYDIVYFAHSFEETDEMSELTKNVSLTPQKLTNTLLVNVKNNNKSWLSAVYVDYSFYDTEDNYVTSGSGSLLSMKAGETQAIAIDIGAEQLESIDLDQSIVEVTVEDNTEFYSYNTTNRVQTTTTLEDGTYNITFTNNATYDVEGSYIIYFYDSKHTLVDAYQETIYIPQDSYDTAYVKAPDIYDTDGELIPIASYKVDTTVHTTQDIN